MLFRSWLLRLTLLSTFAATSLACSGDDDDTSSNLTNTGGSDPGTGGNPATGDLPDGSGGATGETGGGTANPNVTYVEACEGFATAWETACDKYRPESCDGHYRVNGQGCETEGIAFFQCLEQDSPYDCEASVYRNASETCKSLWDTLADCTASQP